MPFYLRNVGSACLLFSLLLAQLTSAQTVTDVEKALSENKPALAKAWVEKEVARFSAARQPDSINPYIIYAGKIAQQQEGSVTAIRKVADLVERIKMLTANPVTLRQALLNAGEFYGLAGKNTLAYKANEAAYRYTLQLPNKSLAQLALVEGNLGTYAQRFGNIALSEIHQRKGISYLQQDAKPDYERLYVACNNMASIMWYASKQDSALLYFSKALQALAKTEAIPLNRFYRKAVVENNIAGVYSLQGKSVEAIAAMKNCIRLLTRFLATGPVEPKKGSAIRLQFEATDNLAGIYKDLGDYKQAYNLLNYSYRQKQEELGLDAPAVFISQILLGQLHFTMKEEADALRFLQEGLAGIAKADGDYLFYQADASSTLALLYESRGDKQQAARYFEKSDSLYEASLQGTYDNIYLEFLSNSALFYAKNGMAPKALAKATKGYRYILKTDGKQSLPFFYRLLNLAEVNAALGNHKEALAYSKEALATVNSVINSSHNLLDSVKMSLKKPKAMLLKAKSEYNLLPQKNTAAVLNIRNELRGALGILEQHKSVLQDAQDIGLLIADHTELLDFIKKLTWELYGSSGLPGYVDELISLHESGLYNRIRSRLDKNEAMQFADLPAATAAKEKKLKAAMASALEGDGTHDRKMSRYLQAVDDWNQYLKTLQKEEPRYYQMRYASIFKSIAETGPRLPQTTTVVRYFFVDKNLLALVINGMEKDLYPIDTASLAANIAMLHQPSQEVGKVALALQQLYRQLWAPVAKSIKHDRVVIIPDGILYNLSFELLTPETIKAFNELATHSLLAKYTIAYQYSLFLSNQDGEPRRWQSNYIAFAPGFTDDVKKKYQVSRKDAVGVDNSYLSLLPQPFTVSLAAKAQKILGGAAYTNETSTLKTFKRFAGGHKIIHIGTHAESNNVYPEYSRLIFAKDTALEDQNSLYLFDIYNCDLTANLAVITACESGRPGYQDGEGMLSLAHAFNYAGSESIITGLWKIDERASAQIMDGVYRNLLAGMPKDEALRQAKLSYLTNSEGRVLAPQYWAGLVLIGDREPVAIERKSGLPWPVLAAGLFILLAVVFLISSRRKFMPSRV